MWQRLAHDEGHSIPATKPYYPAILSRYENVQMQHLFFQADPKKLRPLLPEPLEPDHDGLCVVTSLDAEFIAGYGPYHAHRIVVGAFFREVHCFYNLLIYVSNPRSMAHGRERWGAAKELGDIFIERHDNLLVTKTVQDGVTLITQTGQMFEPIDPGEIPPIAPHYRLKVIPRADGPEPAIKQLVSNTGGDVIAIKSCYRGGGTVQFGMTANVDLTPLQPVKFGECYTLVVDYEESYGEIVYDYLAAE
jgi:acetoacetate decarboxylase